MGYGDELLATGMARGASALGRRIAFGDGKEIKWHHYSKEIFRNNPNIAAPGSEHASDIEWIPFYRGHRLYNVQDAEKRRWIWNYEFRPVPGELFFDKAELNFADTVGKGFVLIEPNVAKFKPVARNKQWPPEHFSRVAVDLIKRGYDVVQFDYGGSHRVPARYVRTPSFRHALVAMRNARLVITGEGGIHHGAAAVGCPAVVIFGGFIPPAVTGYPTHANIAEGRACGNYLGCDHCAAAMRRISVDRVLNAAYTFLKE